MPESERALILLGHRVKDRTAQPHGLVQFGHIVVVIVVAAWLESCVVLNGRNHMNRLFKWKVKIKIKTNQMKEN